MARSQFCHNRVLYAVFKAISVEPTKEELQFVIDVINGGKTDNTERASTICGYFDKQGNEIAYANMLKDVEEIKMAIKILNDCFVPQPKQEVCEHVWRRTGDPDRQSVRCEKCGLLTE